MRRSILMFAAAATFAASSAAAQIRVPMIVQRVIPATRQQPPVLGGIDALRADFRARSGADTVYFGAESAILALPARTTLAAQAGWVRQHPEVVVMIQGHGDPGDTRDHALAMGARRAEEVRKYLVLLGVPAAQLSTTSLGKERPGSPRAVTVLVR